MMPQRFHLQITGIPAGNHGALGHDHVGVGQSLGEVKILLDEEDRQPHLGLDPANGVLDLENDGRLDAFGRLVEHEQLRPRQQRTSDGQHLLLAARQNAALAGEQRLERG